MRTTIWPLKTLVVLSILALLLPVTLTSAAEPPEPTYEDMTTTVVDGDYDEWDLTFDLFADMHRSANPNEVVESHLYVRYDCLRQVVYVLVLAVDGVPIMVEPAGEAYVKIDWSTIVRGSSGNDGTPPDFAWVEQGFDGDDGHARGWEASFPLVDGATYLIDVHTKVLDDRELWPSKIAFGATDLTLACSSLCLPAMDFEFAANAAPDDDPLSAGTLLDEQWADWGIHITTDDPQNHPAMVFNTDFPTGGDPDLGTPNQDFDGPGIGDGGGVNGAGPNMVRHGNILVISDGDPGDPGDSDSGGTIIFTFDRPMKVGEVYLLDIEAGAAGTVTAYDAGDTMLSSVPMQPLGDNSFQVVPVEAEEVRRLEIDLPGSGGVPAVVFCDPPPPPRDPTAVELASFAAGAQGNTIEVRWETVSEIDNLGFHLHRAESPGGPWTRLDDGLIPSQVPPGSPGGAVYQFVDEMVEAGVTYHYRLEGIDVYGQSMFHGLVSAEIGDPLLPQAPYRVFLPFVNK